MNIRKLAISLGLICLPFMGKTSGGDGELVIAVPTSQWFEGWYWNSQIYGAAHTGLFSSERPTLGVHTNIEHRFSFPLTLGLGAGLDVYPNALVMPMYVRAKWNFWGSYQRQLYLGNDLGMYPKLWSSAFNAHFNNAYIGFQHNIGWKMNFTVEAGAMYLWDEFDQSTWDVSLRIGFSTRVFTGDRKRNKASTEESES